MNIEIIKKLKLTRANFCLPEPNQYLILYHYKKDIYIANNGTSLNLAYKTETKEYDFLWDDYLLDVPNSDIDKRLKIDYE